MENVVVFDANRGGTLQNLIAGLFYVEVWYVRPRRSFVSLMTDKREKRALHSDF